MADNWDDILAEPIASLSDPAPVTPPGDGGEGDPAPGGWLAVQALSDISPRPQAAPVTMPPSDTMLQLRLSPQAETGEPSAKLPPSLADQLSLTWAARRRHNLDAEPEAEPALSPRPAPRRVEAPAPAGPLKPVATWRKPLEAVARVFARRPLSEPEAGPAPLPAETPAPPTAPAPRTVLAIAEPSLPGEAPAPRGEMPDVPLTLATPPRRGNATAPPPHEPAYASRQAQTSAAREQAAPPQPPIAPATPRDVPLSATPVVRAAHLEPPAAPGEATRRIESLQSGAADAGPAAAPPAEPTAAPSLAPRRGLLAWLLPRRAAEATAVAPVRTPQAPRAIQSVAPATQPVTPPASIPARQAAPETTLAQALPARRNAARPPAPDETPDEPVEVLPEAPLDAPPEVALTHLLRNMPPDAPAGADAETVRETLSRMVDAAPVTEPAHADTAGDQGETLPAILQQRMEGLLDVPLHEVRIFRGQVSQRLAGRMQADAVTIGNQMHVAPDQGNPALPSGRALLAHEVTHYAVHRLENEGPAATLSATGNASSEPTWPAFTGIAPDAGTASHPAEETLALRVEHAMSRPDAFDAAPPAPGARALPLQHRAQPPQIVVAPGAVPGGAFGGDAGAFAGFSAGAFGGAPTGTGGFGGTGRNGGGVGMAPWDRMVSDAGDFVSDATSMAGQAQDAAQDVQEVAEDFEDNDEMIEKVAEAVIKHMEDKDKFERERRGAFDGNIGG